MATIEDKIVRMIDKLEKNTGLNNLVQGTVMHSLVESVAFEGFKLESDQELQYAKNSIILSNGSDLDEIGERLFGVRRRQSITPTITSDMKILKLYVEYGTFGSINSGKDIEVQKGSILEGLTFNGLVKFATNETIILKSTDNQMFIDAEFILGVNDVIPAGAIVKHNITSYTDSGIGSLKVTNISVVATGRLTEEDDNYRYRLSTALQSFVKTNAPGVHEELTNIPGMSDVFVVNSENGGGTFSVYAKSVSPLASKNLLDDTKRRIDDCVPPWASVNIVSPYYLGLKVIMNVTISVPAADDSFALRDSIKTNIIEKVSLLVNNTDTEFFSIFDIEATAVAVSSYIISSTISEASTFKGESFREETAIDLNDVFSTYLQIAKNEKLIIEPIANAITVRFNNVFI